MAAQIMVINDSEEILEMIRQLLTDEGYSVTTYTAPDLAVAHFPNDKPDAIILDWLFGREDRGMQMLQRLKLRPATASIPIIVCTAAMRRVQEVESFLQAKGVRVVYKPFAVEELLTALSEALQATGLTETAKADESFMDRLGQLPTRTPQRGKRS
jgi:DNA-binding response OmpR family regulator